MSQIRFGIIGYGVQGKVYCDLLASDRTPTCCLSAVSTRSEEKAKAIQETYPGVQTFPDYQSLILSGTCDAVIITVPHFQHHDIAIYAMEHGVHVLVEKPAGIRASDVQKMIDCAKAHPELAFGIFFNQRTNPMYRRIRDVVKSGELGQIRRSIWIMNAWWRPDPYYRQSPWRGTWGGEGGGVLVNQAPHNLDLWQWICGVPTAVTSVNRNGAYRDIAVENDVTMVTQYENGATGCFITCTHDPMGTNRFEIDLDKGKILIEGGNKATIYRLKQSEQEMNETISMEEASKIALANSAGGGMYEVEEVEHTNKWGDQHTVIMENFAHHILSGEPLIAPGEDGILSVRMANASQLSSWTGKTVPLPCDEAEFDKELDRLIAEEGKYPVRG